MDDLIKSLNEFIENSNTEFDRYSYDQLQELCEAMKPYFQNAMAPINETHEETKPEEEPEELPEPEEEKKPEEDAEPEEITDDAKAAADAKPAADAKADAQKKINRHIQSLKDTAIKDLTRETSIINNSAAKIYVIGDIEGHIQLLYNWFINKELIDHELNWKGDENTYVVQCGDQLDSKNRVELGNHSDLEVIIFMDYLNKISDGKVLNIIGNHEIFNTTLEFTDAKIDESINYLSKSFREKILDYNDGLIHKILLRRNFIIRINTLVFCHAAITKSDFNHFMANSLRLRHILQDNRDTNFDIFINYLNCNYDIDIKRYIFKYDSDSNFADNLKTINNEISDTTDSYYKNYLTGLYTILGLNPLDNAYDAREYNGILWNRLANDRAKFPEILKTLGYKVITGHNTDSDNFKLINSDNINIQNFENLESNKSYNYNTFNMIITDIGTRRNNIRTIENTEECNRNDDNQLGYLHIEKQQVTAKYFSCCLPECADIDIFTNVLKNLAEAITGGGGISEDISALLKQNTHLLEIFKDQDFKDFRRLRIAINNFIEHVLFIGLVLRIFEHFKLNLTKVQIGFIKTIKDSINELKDRSDKEMKTYIRLIKNLIQFNFPYTQYYNVTNAESNFSKLLWVLDDKIISQKVSDLKFKLSIYKPPEKIKDFINALSKRDQNISQDISDELLFEILDYILSNRAHGVDINYSTENFAVLQEDKAPDNFVKIDLDSLALPSIYIFVKSKCTNALAQFSGTCYFNAVINGVFLSNNFYKFLKHKLVEYYNSLSAEQKQQFKAQGMTCLAKDKEISREILFNLIKHYLCAINHQFEKIEGSEITEIASAILHKKEVNEGGISHEVIYNILNILFENDRDNYCKIETYPKEIGTAYEGYILDHAVLGIKVKGDRASHMNHAVVGTYCYEDKEPNPIIIDSNRPYNPIYIDWKDPKNNETIIKYFKSVYTYKEWSELEIVYDYVCYLNKEKLKESKEIIIKEENEKILEVCTNYKSD